MPQSKIKELIQEIYKDGFLLSLGVSDEGGSWVADLTYVFDGELNLYWISYPDTRHSVAIEKDSRVAGTITADSDPDDERALQISGTAELVSSEHDMFKFEKQLKEKRGSEAPEKIGEILKGRVWYKLIPKRICLHHTKEYGYDRKVLEM